MAPKSRASKSSSSTASSTDDASARVARSARRERVSAHSTARVGLLSGLLEGTFVMMELLFGLGIVKAAFTSGYRTLNGLSANEDPPPFNAFCIHVATNVVVIAWLVFRMSQKHLPPIPIMDMADKLHLWPLPRSISSSTLRMILTIFTVHFLGTCGMVFVQWATDHWLFSFENYYDPDTGMDWTQTADMILLAPLREELTFRGMVFTIFYLRGVAFKVAPTAPAVVEGDDSSSASFQAVAPSTNESLAWTSSWKLDCIIASSITFGAVHLLNLFGNRYTKTYIILQVFLGMTLGAFYCFRFVLSENAMLETVTLHMINNFFSSFLPIDQELDLTDPLISLPLMLTFVVYGVLNYKQYKLLMSRPPSPFTILGDSATTAVTATPVETKER